MGEGEMPISMVYKDVIFVVEIDFCSRFDNMISVI